MAEKLAIHGGPKAVTNELSGWPSFDEKAIKAVEEILRYGKVNYWTGPKGMEFEKKYAAWQGSKYAISASSGTREAGQTDDRGGGMIWRRFEGGFRIRPGCSARPATARLRRAYRVPILVRLSIRAMQPCILSQLCAKAFRSQ